MEIRNAKTQDVDDILEIINFQILNSTAVYDCKKKTYLQQLKWYEKKIADGMPVIVAESKGEILGFGTFGIFRPWEAYKFSVEHSIYVTENSKGKGIGKQLLKNLIYIAEKQKYHTMIAGVDASNKRSIEFHEKFGFKKVGTINEVGYKFNEWLDLCFLQLIIKNN
jgi:phosphinothricin acetyltransferase